MKWCNNWVDTKWRHWICWKKKGSNVHGYITFANQLSWKCTLCVGVFWFVRRNSFPLWSRYDSIYQSPVLVGYIQSRWERERSGRWQTDGQNGEELCTETRWLFQLANDGEGAGCHRDAVFCRTTRPQKTRQPICAISCSSLSLTVRLSLSSCHLFSLSVALYLL